MQPRCASARAIQGLRRRPPPDRKTKFPEAGNENKKASYPDPGCVTPKQSWLPRSWLGRPKAGGLAGKKRDGKTPKRISAQSLNKPQKTARQKINKSGGKNAKTGSQPKYEGRRNRETVINNIYGGNQGYGGGAPIARPALPVIRQVCVCYDLVCYRYAVLYQIYCDKSAVGKYGRSKRAHPRNIIAYCCTTVAPARLLYSSSTTAVQYLVVLEVFCHTLLKDVCPKRQHVR